MLWFLVPVGSSPIDLSAINNTVYSNGGSTAPQETSGTLNFTSASSTQYFGVFPTPAKRWRVWGFTVTLLNTSDPNETIEVTGFSLAVYNVDQGIGPEWSKTESGTGGWAIDFGSFVCFLWTSPNATSVSGSEVANASEADYMTAFAFEHVIEPNTTMVVGITANTSGGAGTARVTVQALGDEEPL